MQSKFDKLIEDANKLGKDILKFHTEFIDETGFKKFTNENLGHLCQNFDDICISGYFSEGFARILTKSIKGLNTRIRIITSEHNVSRANDKKNLASLRKIQDAGVEVRVNLRTHFRMFLCRSDKSGLLVLGSFDFNKEGMNEERKDAGIKTSHPDLIESAFDYFNKVWEDEYNSEGLDEMYPPPSKSMKSRKRTHQKGKSPIIFSEKFNYPINEKPPEPWEYNREGSGIIVTNRVPDGKSIIQNILEIRNGTPRYSILRTFEEVSSLKIKYDLYIARYHGRKRGTPFIIESPEDGGAPNGSRVVYMTILDGMLHHGFPNQEIIEIKTGQWYKIEVEVNCKNHNYICWINGVKKAQSEIPEEFTKVNKIRTKHHGATEDKVETYIKDIIVEKLS